MKGVTQDENYLNSIDPIFEQLPSDNTAATISSTFDIL